MHKATPLKYILSAFAIIIAGCSQPEHEAKNNPDDSFQLTDSLLNNLKIDTVKAGDAASSITLTGVLAPDETKMVKIFPMVSGITERVRVQLGDHVAKGQILANMRSVEIAGFAKDEISAQADLRNAKRALSSTQDLYRSGLASEKDMEQARAEYDKSAAEHNRAKSVMSINRSNNQGYEVRTPISGFIVEKNVTSNTQVRSDNEQNMFTVADLSTIYVLINIYESDISKVKQGDKVRITALSYPDKTFSGAIEKLYDMIDPEKRVMQARVRIENPGYLLKPEMYANVTVTGKAESSLPVVNIDNIIFDDSGNYVLIRDGKANVRVQAIQIARRVEDRAYVSSGIKSGDQVIASRQVFLYESLKK